MNDKEKGRYFTITSSDGSTIEYEILFTFDSDETKKSYIVFTDNTKDESGSINTYAATYTKEDDKLTLDDIATEKEWGIIESLLSQIEDKVNEK